MKNQISFTGNHYFLAPTPIYTFKINRTIWEIWEVLPISNNDNSFFRVRKNGMEVGLINGNDFETLNEAEINILLEYKV